MYYRRKILLAILEAFGGELERIRLQKLLLLFTKKQEKAAFDFVPYKFGCFSFQANADLHTMMKYGQVSQQEKWWFKEDSKDYTHTLNTSDRKLLFSIKEQYDEYSTQELLRETYLKYPFYAINSTIAEDVLQDNELQDVHDERIINNSVGLYTIGYEGISFEAYLNKLLKHDIKALIDVRKNAMSMKYGFNKSQLKKACEGLGIQYLHYSEVGVKSSKRKELNTQEDYDNLFEDYKTTVLPDTISTQQEISNNLKKYKRVALTCFEADSCQCHRKPLAEFIMEGLNNKYELIHL